MSLTPDAIRQRQAGLSGRTWTNIAGFVRRKPLGAAGALIIIFLVSVAICADVLATHSPKVIVGGPFEPPDFSKAWNAWGTDNVGRDVFSRIVYGARISLYVSLTATIWGTTIGVTWGLLQGYWGGSLFDTVSQRLLEGQLAIPGLILALTFVAVFGPTLANVILAIGLNYVPSAARTIRATTLGIRENAYIDAARAIGASDRRIIFFHVFPNTFSIYLVLLSLHVGGAILAESSLSFLGVGLPADEPSWGGMVTLGASQALLQDIPWLALFPGLSIASVVYGFNLFGDALRDILDPRLRGSRGR